MKVYAVKKGHKTGIFDNWVDCQAATKGFSGPKFKSFTTREEAEAYLEDRDIWVEQVAKDNSAGYLVAFTDGSYDKGLKRYSYGVKFIRPDGSEEDICGYGSNQEYIDSNNIIGEIFGVINALNWAISNEFEKIKIYHDYEGLSKWISGEWTANSKVAKMYTSLYELKFKDFLEVRFKKVSGHSNVIYNEKADQLAKSALVDRKKVTVQGDNWFSIPYFKQDDFNAFVELIEESDEGIIHSITSASDRDIYKFKLNREVITVTLFKTGQQKLLLQGKNNYLFQIITATIIELYDDSHVEQILGDAYRINIKQDVVSNAYNLIESGLPNNYPVRLKRLIKQAIINMTHYVESEEYSMYIFPALRALEGHIKYLITEADGNPGRQFSCFGYDRTMIPNRYVVTESFPDRSKNGSIEKCYNYYKSQRDTVFHFGDIIGQTDNTRLIETKEEADEIIKHCLSLISTEQ